MKSIRNRLLAWELCGVAILLAATGSCIYFTVRYVLYSQVEEELGEARRVIYNVFENQALEPGFFLRGAPPGRRLRFRDEERWRQFDFEDGELVYQLRHSDGEILLRSPSLGERALERPAEIPPRESVSLRGADGTRFLARIDEASPRKWPALVEGNEPSRDASIEIIVARDLTEVRRTLSLVIAGIWGAGLAAAVFTGLLVSLGIRRGLAPLTRLGEEASRVDASRLTTRFGDEDMPRELLPIVERLNHLMDRLEHSFERERRFSSDLAHELRTPIAELSTLSESAVLFPDKVPPDRFERILATSRRMQQIVENLLLLARSEQEESERNLEPVDLAKIARESWEPHSEAAEEKDLEVTLALENGHSLTTDPGLFHHILENLFSNAVEYTPRGGTLTVETFAGANGSTAGLSVSNSVEGMDASDLPHLFERFWRSDSARTGTAHGGLGLSLAKACADALSLELEAKLEDGQIRFRIAPAGEPGE